MKFMVRDIRGKHFFSTWDDAAQHCADHDIHMPNDHIEERDELLADAERYRWLREQHNEQMPIAAVCWKKGSIPSSALWCNMIDAADLDQHIDAARRDLALAATEPKGTP